MKHQFSSKERKELKLKMATVFSEKLQMLSTELQQILIDDMVSAFENRLKVLNRAQSSVIGNCGECELCVGPNLKCV
jgi:hypothetical protein